MFKKPETSKAREDRIWAAGFDGQPVMLDGHIGLARQAIINPVKEKRRPRRRGYLIHYSELHKDEKEAYGVLVIYFKGGDLMREFVGYGRRRRLKWATKEEVQEARASLQLPYPLDFY